MNLDYISILAGGSCPNECPFCVGRSLRKSKPIEKPHFSVNWQTFLMSYDAPEISISGSTSDPMLCNTEDLFAIINDAPQLSKSLHTAYPHLLWKYRKSLHALNEICLSVHNYSEIEIVNELTKYFNHQKCRTRISSVYWDKSKEILSDKFFYELFQAKIFTIRKNIFESNIEIIIPYPKIGTLYGQQLFSDNNKIIVLWDFLKANTIIKAMYLWPDGQIREQCYWTTLHEKDII